MSPRLARRIRPRLVLAAVALAAGLLASPIVHTQPSASMPADVRALVERQAQGAQRNHDEVRALRDTFAKA